MQKIFPTPFAFLLLALLTASQILAAPADATAAAPLPPPLAASLRDAQLPAAHAAFFIQRVDAAEPLLAWNARKAMNPASTMKLVTAYAALELLGPAHTWTTQALADAPLADGTLAGNLYLKGSGDPALTMERLWFFVHQLRSRGLTRIGGDVILDRSDFLLPPHDPAAFDNQPLRPYNAGPDALLADFNSLRLTLIPEPLTKTVRVVRETPAEDVLIAAQIALTDGPCGDWSEKIAVTANGNALTLSGSFAAACGEKTLHLAPWTADVHFGQLFRALWKEAGGSVDGTVRNGIAPAGARRLLTHTSPPLAEVVRDLNKWSNNVMARQLFLALSGERPATPEAARARIGAWLREKGIDGVVIDNGAGLSREARLSAEALGRLLLAAWQSPVMPELIASLPIAGRDGTLKKRLADSAAAGRAHLKTGYIEGVRALAGYVMDRRGRRWVVVGFLNDAQMKKGSQPLDALVRWVAER